MDRQQIKHQIEKYHDKLKIQSSEQKQRELTASKIVSIALRTESRDRTSDLTSHQVTLHYTYYKH